MNLLHKYSMLPYLYMEYISKFVVVTLRVYIELVGFTGMELCSFPVNSEAVKV